MHIYYKYKIIKMEKDVGMTPCQKLEIQDSFRRPRPCEDLPQPPKTRCRGGGGGGGGVAEDCWILTLLPRRAFLYH